MISLTNRKVAEEVKDRAYLRPVCFFAVLLSVMGSDSHAASDAAVTVAVIPDKGFELHKSRCCRCWN